MLVGAGGQVGTELRRTLSPLGDVMEFDRSTLDLTRADAIRDAVRSCAPDVIVNAAAYTQVDRAESEEELANRVNADAPAVLAEEGAARGALLVHYSTDYVFDGTASRSYREDDLPAPRTAYGRSKWLGDQRVLGSAVHAFVFRVGWVYANSGRNFLTTVRRLARERDVLRIVNDQRGGPTWSREIARCSAAAIDRWLAGRRDAMGGPPRGVYHMAPPDHTSWHGFASTILEEDARRAPPGARVPALEAIGTADFPTPATRPAWSVLDPTRLRETFGLTLPAWREQLVACLDDGRGA